MRKVKFGHLITRRRIKIGLPIFVVLSLIFVAVLIIKNMNGPAEGIVSQQPVDKTEVKKLQNNSGEYDGKYFSFTYPPNYEKIASKLSGGYLEIFKLYSTDHNSKQISIGVVKESIDNDSGVNYRRSHPNLYKKQSNADESLVFAKTQNGSEYTGFLTHNGLVASISLNSPFTKDLSSDYQTIVKNWQWKQ